MSFWQAGSPYNNTSLDVGSFQSLDEFAGLGTAFMNPDRFYLDIGDRVHMLGPKSSPFLSWLQLIGTRTAHQVVFTWLESELFLQRDLKCTAVVKDDGSGHKLVALRLKSGADWQAFSTAATADQWDANEEKPLIFMTVHRAADTSQAFSAVLRKGVLELGPIMRDIVGADDTTKISGIMNSILLVDETGGSATIGGVTGELSDIPSGVGLANDPSTFLANVQDGDEIYVTVSTPNDYLKGYPQGSGLPSESRRKTRSVRNYVQIFKTPYSITNTLKAITGAGGTRGGNELANLRLRKAIEHKTDLETAILFQGGGVEGEDWGYVGTYDSSSGTTTTFENPLTRFKGLGVGLAVNGLTEKPGFIVTKNADLNSKLQFNPATADMAALNSLMAEIFDDNVDSPSTTKVAYCSLKWLGALSELALKADGASGVRIFGQRVAAPGQLGLVVTDLVTPFGRLTLVPFPRFRGKYENYALVVDFANMEFRPLVGRATTLKANVASQDVDGQIDYYITEAGFECRHESTHAVLKLV